MFYLSHSKGGAKLSSSDSAPLREQIVMGFFKVRCRIWNLEVRKAFLLILAPPSGARVIFGV